MKIINFLLFYLKEKYYIIENHFDFMKLLFHFIGISKKQNLFDSVLNKYPELPIMCLSFIYKNKEKLADEYFILWQRVFFPDCFDFSESGLRMIFKMGDEIKNAEEINLFIKAFLSASEIFLSDKALLNTALNVLDRILEKYPTEFYAILDTFERTIQVEELKDKMEKRQQLRLQIYTLVESKRLLENLKIDFEFESISVFDPNQTTETFDIWNESLEQLELLNFNSLKIEDRIIIKDFLTDRFSKIYEEYCLDFNDEKLLVLNSFIPIFGKFGEVSENMRLNFVNIVTNLTDIYERISIFTGNMNEFDEFSIKKYLVEFHGEVFDNSEIAALNVIKFSKYWKMNIFGVKIFIDFMINDGWYADEVLIENLAYRIMVLPDEEECFDIEEQQNLEEIIDFYYQELRIISKTQMMAFYILLKN